LAFGVPPFVQPTPSDRLYSLFLKKPEYLYKYHPATRNAFREDSIDKDLIELISAMFASDPKNRPSSISDIFQNFKYLSASESDLEDEEASKKLHELHSSLQC